MTLNPASLLALVAQNHESFSERLYNRFRRWEARDMWKKLWQHMQQHSCRLATQALIDATIMRAHHLRRVRKKNGGQEAQALGRSRGGFSTKLHAACTNEETGIVLLVTSGARHDAPGFELVWHALPDLPVLDAAVMDKGYDSDAIREVLAEQDIDAVIPVNLIKATNIFVVSRENVSYVTILSFFKRETSV